MKENMGIVKRQSSLEKSLDNWVAISVIGNGTQVGFLKEVIGREITLNPHKAWRYDKENDCNLYKMVNENCYMEVSSNGYLIEPTNLETINYSIRESNNQIIQNKKK